MAKTQKPKYNLMEDINNTFGHININDYIKQSALEDNPKKKEALLLQYVPGMKSAYQTIGEGNNQLNKAREDKAMSIPGVGNTINTLRTADKAYSYFQEQEQEKKKELIKDYSNREDIAEGSKWIPGLTSNYSFTGGMSPLVDGAIGTKESLADQSEHISRPVGRFLRGFAGGILFSDTEINKEKIGNDFGLVLNKDNKWDVPDRPLQTEADISFRRLQQKAASDLNRESTIGEDTMGSIGGLVGMLPYFMIGGNIGNWLLPKILPGIGRAVETGVRLAPSTLELLGDQTLNVISKGTHHILNTITSFVLGELPKNTINALNDKQGRDFFTALGEGELQAATSGLELGFAGFALQSLPMTTANFILKSNMKNEVAKHNWAMVGKTITQMGTSFGTGAGLAINEGERAMWVNGFTFMGMHLTDVGKTTAEILKNEQDRKFVTRANNIERVQNNLSSDMYNIDKNIGRILEMTDVKNIDNLPLPKLEELRQILKGQMENNMYHHKAKDFKKAYITVVDKINSINSFNPTRPITDEESIVISGEIVKRDVADKVVSTLMNETKKEPTNIDWMLGVKPEIGSENYLGASILPFMSDKALGAEKVVIELLHNLNEGAKKNGQDMLTNPDAEVVLKDGRKTTYFEAAREYIKKNTSGISDKKIENILNQGFKALYEDGRMRSFLEDYDNAKKVKIDERIKEVSDLDNINDAIDKKIERKELDKSIIEMADSLNPENIDEGRANFIGTSYSKVKQSVTSQRWSSSTDAEFYEKIQKEVAEKGYDKAHEDFVDENLLELSNQFGDLVDPVSVRKHFSSIMNTWSQKVPTDLVNISIFSPAAGFPDLSITTTPKGMTGEAFSLRNPGHDIAKVLNWDFVKVANFDMIDIKEVPPGTPFDKKFMIRDYSDPDSKGALKFAKENSNPRILC
jgi:hypothetical protein